LTGGRLIGVNWGGSTKGGWLRDARGLLVGQSGAGVGPVTCRLRRDRWGAVGTKGPI